MATYPTNALVDSIAASTDTFPRSAAGTGTLITRGVEVTGTGTAFTTETKIGDYIYLVTPKEFRRVMFVTSDTVLQLDTPFTADFTPAGAYRIVPASRNSSVFLKSVGANVINGKAVADGAELPWGKTTNHSSRTDFMDPILIEAGGTVYITATVK